MGVLAHSHHPRPHGQVPLNLKSLKESLTCYSAFLVGDRDKSCVRSFEPAKATEDMEVPYVHHMC